jgi:hypothetical protein
MPPVCTRGPTAGRATDVGGLAAGEELSRVGQPHGNHTVAVGDEIAGVGPDGIVLLDLP